MAKGNRGPEGCGSFFARKIGRELRMEKGMRKNSIAQEDGNMWRTGKKEGARRGISSKRRVGAAAGERPERQEKREKSMFHDARTGAPEGKHTYALRKRNG